MFKKKKNIFRIIVLGIVGVFLGVSIYSWNAKNLVGNQMPMPLGFGVSVVLSGSMEPELSVNDLVFITKTDEIAIDDVIVYQSGNSLVIHRVIDIDGEMITTMGDANTGIDDPIHVEQVKGKLAFSIPLIGALFLLLKEPLVVILIIGVIIVLMELSYRKEKVSDQEDLDKIRKEIIDLSKEIQKK